ncbi:MAG: DUF190 domain-containing protein [Candidatus Omnitrophica bacterium]|nr:DUF190 domain-containing protein [Candidatus Omnitrophota bacterium]
MKMPLDAKVLKIFIGEQEKWKGKPLYEAIVDVAREKKMAGATVLKGCLGFGANSHMHTSKILSLSEDLPMIIEIVDGAEKIEHFLPLLDEMIKDGLVTVEPINVVIYKA